MNADQQQLNIDENADALFSLASLQGLHRDLLQARRKDGETDQVLDRATFLIQRGQLTGTLLDTDEDRATAQAILDYWSAILYKAGRLAPDATLEEFDPDLAPELPESLCPYVGLDPFREATREVFFGRERLVSSLIEHLRDSRFLVVVGPSGSGKSSLVLAGLLPTLKNAALPDSQSWRYAPRVVPGSNPLANLTRMISSMKTDEIGDIPAWEREQIRLLRCDPHGLTKLANELGPQPLVVVVDQFEEVFTLCNDDELRRALLGNLESLVLIPGCGHRVILTMRADFWGLISLFPEFQALCEPAVVTVTPLSAAELREAIEKPARRIGLKFETGLVDQLLHDVLGEAAALPLLQFTLRKLWDYRVRNRITREAYVRLGGGRLALARCADELYDKLIPEEQLTAKRIFLRLVRLGDGLEFTSNRVRLQTLYAAGEAGYRVERVVNRLVEAQLLRVSEGDIVGDTQIEVAHEALVRNWPRLVDWLEEERHMLRRRQALRDAAERWYMSGKDAGTLFTTETAVEEALRIVEVSGLALDSQEVEFIRESQEVQEAARREKEAARQRELEQARTLAEAESRRAQLETQRAQEQAISAQRLRRLTWVLVGLAVFAFVAAAIALSSALQVQGEKKIAIAARGTAEAGATQVVAAKGEIEARAALAAEARVTAESGATQTAKNLEIAQGSLKGQDGLALQVQVAKSTEVALVSQIQTLQANSAQPSARQTPALAQMVEPGFGFNATATAVSLAYQRSAIQATQTAIAVPNPLYAILPQISIGLRAGPGTGGEKVETVTGPRQLRVEQFSDRGWVQIETPSGNLGWLYGTWVTYTGNRDLLPDNLAYRYIDRRSDLPFIDGRVISYDDTQTEYTLLLKPALTAAGSITVPIGTTVTVLGVGNGDLAFGSTRWYFVTLADPFGANQTWNGYLPAKIVAQQ